MNQKGLKSTGEENEEEIEKIAESDPEAYAILTEKINWRYCHGR